MAKKRDDITKTGALKWNDLQTLNALNSIVGMDIQPVTIQDINQDLNAQGLASEVGALTNILGDLNYMYDRPVQTDISMKSGGRDWWGNSAFDKDIAVGPFDVENLSDIRAENQPWYSKLVNGVGKAGVLAATTALETAGLLYGAGHSLLETAGVLEDNGQSWLQDLWDNPISNTLQKINDLSEEYMPNYYTEDEIENPWSNIFTANFLGDKLLKNLGFMVGAFYGGVGTNWLLGAGKRGIGLIPNSTGVLPYRIGRIGTNAVKDARAALLAERTGMARRVGELTAQYGDDAQGLERALAANGLTEAERGKRILEGFDKIRDIAKGTRATTQTIGALGSAINEGAIEALNNSKDWARHQTMLANDEYQQVLANIEQQYGGTEMETTLKMQAAEDHERKLAEIEKGRARMGNADLLLNIPILIASNMYQLGKLYTRGFDSTRRQMGSLWNGHALQGSLTKGTLKSSKTSKGAIASALWKSNTEGLEEYLQRAASDGAGEAVNESIRRFMEAGHGEESKTEIDDYIAGFGKAIADNLGDPSAWEEYMIGALSSMVGMPVFGSQTKNAYGFMKNNGVFGFAGGIIGNYNDYMDARDHENKVAGYLNTHVQDYQNFRRGSEESIADYLHRRVNDPKFKALYQYLKVESDYDKWLQEQIEAGDKSNYKDLEAEEFYKFLNAAASSGHLEEFKQIVGYNTEYSDEELEDIVKQTTRTISPEQQRKQDEDRKAVLEKKYGFYPSSALIGDRDAIDEYETINARLSQYEESIKEGSIVENPYKNKLEGPFIDINGQMNVTNPDKMRKILERNRQNLLQGINDYLKIRNDIDIETDGRLDDKQIELLTQMRGKILSYDKRSAEMAYDLAVNLEDVLGLQKSWKDKVSQELEKAQNLFNNVSRQLENAKKRNDKKREIERLEKSKTEAEYKLNKAKAASRGTDNAIKLLEMLVEERETTAKERAAEAKGRGEGFIDRLYDRFDRGQTRIINSDEAQSIVGNPQNALSLISIINSSTSYLDSNTRQRLSQEVIDLATLANEKMAYNRKVREFLGDPSKINEAFRQAQDEVSQKDKDNKSDELALRIREASRMTDLDGIMREAYQQNPEIARAAMQKAKNQGDNSQKQFISDYEKGLNFFGNFGQQASQLPAEVSAGVMETAVSAWEYALQDGTSPYNTFIQAMNDAADDLDKTGQEEAKAEAAAIRRILKDLDAATKATATNKESKKGTVGTSRKNATTSDDETPDNDDKKSLAGLAALRKKREVVDSKDSLTKDIEQSVLHIFKYEGIASVKYDNLPKNLKDRISKFNEANPDDMLVVDDVLTAALEKAVDGNIVAQSYEVSSGDGAEVVDYEEGSKRAEDMHNNLRVTFKSDHPTEFRFNVDYRIPYVSEDPQLMAIQKLMKEYKAYQFVDKNYLGYVAMAHNGHPTIHFLKSTDPNVDGNGGTDSTIFMAVKWDRTAQDAVRKYGFGGKNNTNLMDEVSPVTIDGEQYQIVGVMTLNAQVQPEVSAAFAAVQNAINGELNPQMEAAREAGQSFVLSKMTTQVNQIFTGRLEKRNDENDPENKVSLYDFLTTSQDNSGRRTSTEWDSGMDFYFGIIVNGFLNTTDKEDVTNRIEYPNDIWMEKNNGAVVMFVPKADGRLYPIRCTRLTVTNWLSSVVDGQHSGLELLTNVLSGEKNAYLNNILKYLKTILDSDSTVADRMKAKMMLSKYFIFGKQSPIHFNEDSVSLTFGNSVNDIEGDTFEEQVNSFFNILSENNVMFSLPTSSIEEVNGRDVIKAGIFEIGLRGFYNFNANFTVDPIDGDGNPVTIEIHENNNDVFHGGAGNRATQVEFDLGDGLKTYTIEGDGTVLESGERASSEKQNLISLAIQAEQGNMPQLLQEMLSALYPRSAEVREYISDSLPTLQGVFIIHADGQDWVYDGRKVNHNERLYKLTPEVRREFTQTIRNFTTKPESMEQIKKLKTVVKPGSSSRTDSTVQPEQPSVPMGPSAPKRIITSSGSSTSQNMFAGKTLDEMNDKGSPLETLLASNPKNPIIKKVFEILQGVEEAGMAIDQDRVYSGLTAVMSAERDEKKKMLADLIDEIKGCH